MKKKVLGRIDAKKILTECELDCITEMARQDRTLLKIFALQFNIYKRNSVRFIHKKFELQSFKHWHKRIQTNITTQNSLLQVALANLNILKNTKLQVIKFQKDISYNES